MSGKFIVPSSVRTVAKYAFYSLNCFLEEIIFQEGLQRTEEGSLSGVKIITLPASLTHIDKETFDGEYMFHIPTIRAPRNSVAHRFAVKHGYKFIPSDCSITWETTGAGAQEEYLFRCSDYYKFLYRYAPYAEQYGVTRSHYQYPLDRDFGGIFSGGVTIFRENEATGYRLTDKPWKVNMIAVAGMNSPRFDEDGEERIASELVEGVKNKIRTILRIARDRGQENLVLGAIGCGAFHNPPKHVAELFREILCEHEFYGAFKKICFAVKTSHTSKGDTNFSAFKESLDGFIPTLKADSVKIFENPVKKKSSVVEAFMRC